MTLEDTINALRAHLQGWYDQRKTLKKVEADGREPHDWNGIKTIWPYELRDAVNEFMKLHPECEQHRFDIYYDFKAKDNTYRAGCICGDGCDFYSHVGTTGIVVEQMDWDKAASNAQVA